MVCAALACGSTACSVYDPTLIAGQGQDQRAAAGAGTQISASQAADGGRRDCTADSGSCARPHAVATCVSGACLIVSCLSPYVDCDEIPDNGCESDLKSADHCGLCSASCRFSHAAASCEAGQCKLGACEAGYTDCDSDVGNGCERALDTISDCGACSTRCAKGAHGAAVCEDGKCGLRCDAGYGDCNGRTNDGCEQQLNAREHCGACGHTCDAPNSLATDCQDGECVVTGCAQGQTDCNGLSGDGCEAQLTNPSDCGACGARCQLPHVSALRCDFNAEKASCQIARTCDGDPESCRADAAMGCSNDYADCDGNAANGCETDLRRLTSCGACGRSCVQPHSQSECRDGECAVMGCASGYAQCSRSGPCVSLQNDAKNCGKCGQACPSDAPRCAGGVCTAERCSAGTADCEGGSDAAAGCETALSAVDHCGGCAVKCPTPAHASAACKDGGCAVGECASGWADCNGDPADGCEVDLSSADDCGKCASPCALPHASSRCDQGNCRLGQCDAGRADCDGSAANGCEADLSLPQHCRSCANTCDTAANVASASCGQERCALRCKPGFADCDGSDASGCEADLSAATSCGGCGMNCRALPNVDSASCQGGGCSDLRCTASYADCNGDAGDGCERFLRSATDCGACDSPCALAHATPDCSSGACRILMCDTGFGDCDGRPENGCETALSSRDHCGSCPTACAAGSSCDNGRCGCGADAECGTGEACCEGQCTNIGGTCFPWPCIPGTDLNVNRFHCGGCGANCITFCCGPLL
jgi:hypothetical protein